MNREIEIGDVYYPREYIKKSLNKDWTKKEVYDCDLLLRIVTEINKKTLRVSTYCSHLRDEWYIDKSWLKGYKYLWKIKPIYKIRPRTKQIRE